jgi:hypothetical protein
MTDSAHLKNEETGPIGGGADLKTSSIGLSLLAISTLNQASVARF